MSVLVSPAAEVTREAASREEARLDGCRPALCSLGAKPHAHCVCGLPMPVRARLCDLCRREGRQPQPRRNVESALEWNGRRYPSRRQRRCGDPHPDGHLKLLIAILAPARGKEAGA